MSNRARSSLAAAALCTCAFVAASLSASSLEPAATDLLRRLYPEAKRIGRATDRAGKIVRGPTSV